MKLWFGAFLLIIAAILWIIGRNNPDDVFGLLEKILACALLLLVIVFERNIVLETVFLVIALLLPMASKL